MYTIIGLGEVLWDVFEDGKVLGGAPANFAYHAHCLGHTGLVLSRVGTDELGDDILSALDGAGLCTEFIQRDGSHPTGRVLVQLDAEGDPTFTIVEDVAWDCMEPERRWLDAARGADVVCFGTLAQRTTGSRCTIGRVLDAAANAVRIFDVNLRQQFYSEEILVESLGRATILKLNAEEVARLGEMFGGEKAEADFARRLMSEHGIELVCVTRGADGCTLHSPDQSVSRPVPPTQAVDTVGAGDAFSAALAVKYLEGRPLDKIADAANFLGACVAAGRGAMPPVPEEVVEHFAGF